MNGRPNCSRAQEGLQRAKSARQNCSRGPTRWSHSVDPIAVHRGPCATPGTEFYSAVFLRNDVYDILLSQTPDRGKDSIALVDWNQPALMRQMIRKRLMFNSTDKTLSVEHLWHNIAVPVLNGEDTLQFLISRSMMRPRYLLRLINHCKGSAINFGRDRIDKSDIEVGLSTYSTDVVTEIGLEMRDVHPASEDILYALVGEMREMKRSKIEALLSAKFTNPSDLAATITLLFWHGVLGFRRSASEVTYIYDVNYDLKRLLGVMDKAGVDPMIEVNPALWAGLELS
ncbi:P-loop ATPase, Sll1717 family [Bradyrhizobium erythrophlei]|uniref:P-loop ATPase, Sll1717 family n=1 Tax=Bradyrhizobium erythrophlei TaxID=1437360 RepID=UPI003CC7E4A3